LKEVNVMNEVIMLVIATTSTTFAIASQIYQRLYNSKYKIVFNELESIKKELNYIRQRIDFITIDIRSLTDRVSKLEGYLNKYFNRR